MVIVLQIIDTILFKLRTGVVPNSENPLQNPPLNGAAFNGIAAANSNAPDVSGRLGATLTNLATAVAYSPGSLADAANSVYVSLPTDRFISETFY